MKGEIVGANSATLESGQNLNFAICAEDIALVLKQAASGRLKQLSSMAPLGRVPVRRTRPGNSGTDKQVVCNLPADRRFRHRFKIAKEEDEFDKVAWIRTEWLPLKHNDRRLGSCGLRVGLLYREDSPAPFAMWEVGTTAKSFAFIGPGTRRFQLLIDDESVLVSDPQHKGEIRRGRNGLGAGVAETLSTLLRLDDFLEIIMASKVKARVGALEYELSKEQLECLRDLASRLPTGATADGEFLVGRYTKDEDPSIANRSKRPSSSNSARAKSRPKSSPSTMPEFRKWTSADGKFSIEAKFVRIQDGNVVLIRKDNGKEISVPLDKLGASDRVLARRL
jgi:hypothetical protein